MLLISLTINLNAQSKAKLILKKDFKKPLIDRYSIIIIRASNDTAYCYYPISFRAYDEKIYGIYVEIDKNKIKFECYLAHGNLNGLFRRYNNSEQLWKYGKYLDNVLIENNEIFYDENMNIIETKQTFPNTSVFVK